jgi:integrase
MVAGHLQDKGGQFYAVLNYKDAKGKRHTKWIPTGLSVKGNKKRAEMVLAEIRRKFVPPAQEDDETIPADVDMSFVHYLDRWLKITKTTVKPATYASYAQMLSSVIRPYFEEKGFTLIGLQASDIQDFYLKQLERVSPNTVIHYHAIIHKALKYAVRIDLIPTNPADKVDRPKKNAFTPGFYDSEEIMKLFALVEDTELELPVKLAAFYGLRRSECIGLRWSAIDFNNNTLTVNHTVACIEVDGKKTELATDTAKTKSSLRTLPLVPVFRELLLRKRAEQMEFRRVCGKAYCTDFLDYVCVDQLGRRTSPQYLTEYFPKFLRSHGMRVIRFHDLRHSCASMLLANGVPMKQIQEWMGHSDFSTTANIYAHLDYQSKVSSAEAMLAGLGLKATGIEPIG